MNPTAAELVLLVRKNLSEESEQFFNTPAIMGFLNDGQDFLVREELYTTQGSWGQMSVPRATAYLLPEDLLAPQALYGRPAGGQPYRVEFEQGDDMDRRTFMARSASVASVVSTVTYHPCPEGLYAEIWPALDDYYPLRWVGAKRLKRLVESTDRTECPPGLTGILTDYATWYCKLKDEEPRQADQWMNKVLLGVREARARRMRSLASDQYPRVRIRRRVGRFPR